MCASNVATPRLTPTPTTPTHKQPKKRRDYLSFVPGIVGLTKFIIRVVHNQGDVTLVTSPQLKTELESFGVKRVHVWKKGIDTERFNPKFKSAAMRERLTEGNPQDPLLIYVGRLGAEKKLKTIRCVLFWLGNRWGPGA